MGWSWPMVQLCLLARGSELMKYLYSALMGLLMFPAIHASEMFGLALHVEGEVLVTRGIMEFEAQVEEVLMWEDEIETGDDGSIQISFDSSFLSIGPNSYVHFEREKGDEGEELFVMNLEEGSFRSKILNLCSRQFFEVRSETGSLRVHGTDFVTTVDPDAGDSFNVSVLHGAVAVNAPEADSASDSSVVNAPIMLTQNQTGGVGPQGAAVEVGDMSFADADEIKGQLPIPGDEDEGLIIADLGIENLEVETLVEDVKQDQEASVVEAPPEEVVQAAQRDLLETNTVSVSIVGSIDDGLGQN